MKISHTEMVDIAEPELVEIKISKDGKSIWVNVEEVCMLRCGRIKKLVIEDECNPISAFLKWIHKELDEASDYIDQQTPKTIKSEDIKDCYHKIVTTMDKIKNTLSKS